jgi:phosphoribosylaminoimidazole-succinocarboxamide synthase
MGSVKELIISNSPAGKLYKAPTNNEFGLGAWKVSGRFSVGDLKSLIPDSNIENKAEALTMITANFFEWLANKHPDIPTCYEGILDYDGKITDTQDLMTKGQTSNIIVMKLAHVPDTYCKGNLDVYRAALTSGELQCGVADVESIFRNGVPLGSSIIEKIFKAVDMHKEYLMYAKYDETVLGLDIIRKMVAEYGLSNYPSLEKVLSTSGLGTTIPNPGFILNHFVYNTTTKFEESGDRDISEEDAKKLSGLSEEGYRLWADTMFPASSAAQIQYAKERGVLNIDGKGECVAYHRMPIVTDFMCTPDENRLMITVEQNGETWAIPSNKEIQRAIFREEGIYFAIDAAKGIDPEHWKNYIPDILDSKGIDINAVSKHSCILMGSAISEVANRLLGKTMFDAKPLNSWVNDFMPYASKVEMQK